MHKNATRGAVNCAKWQYLNLRSLETLDNSFLISRKIVFAHNFVFAINFVSSPDDVDCCSQAAELSMLRDH